MIVVETRSSALPKAWREIYESKRQRGRLARRAAFLAALLGAGVSACSPVFQAQGDYKRSTAAYRECIKANGPASCEKERVLMVTDERTFTTTAGVWAPGHGGTVNMNAR